MSRGRKSTLRAHEKRHQTRGDTHSVKGAQATATEEEGSASSSPGRSRHSSPTARVSQEPPSAPLITAVAAGAWSSRATGGAKGQDEGGPSSSEVSAPTERSWKETLNRKKAMLLHLLLNKCKTKEPIKKAEMTKTVNRRYKQHFPELLRRVSEHMELAFGLELQEADSKGETRTLVSKLEITEEEILGGGRGVPKNGILLPLLGMIYRNGKWATEEEVWESLSELGVCSGERRCIYGKPRKLITNDLVEEKYLKH